MKMIISFECYVTRLIEIPLRIETTT